MLRAILCLGLAAAVLSVTGCAMVADLRGDSEICKIHHTYMNSVKVSRASDPKARTPEYLEARAKYFVHSYPSILPQRVRTSYMVYICDKCVQAEKEWKAAHPTVKR